MATVLLRVGCNEWNNILPCNFLIPKELPLGSVKIPVALAGFLVSIVCPVALQGNICLHIVSHYSQTQKPQKPWEGHLKVSCQPNNESTYLSWKACSQT